MCSVGIYNSAFINIYIKLHRYATHKSLLHISATTLRQEGIMSTQVGANKKNIACVINVAVSKGFSFLFAAFPCYNSLMSKH